MIKAHLRITFSLLVAKTLVFLFLMALSIIALLAGGPAILGISESIRSGQSGQKKEEHRARRCNLIVTCVSGDSADRSVLEGKKVVLRNGKVFTVMISRNF
jgi:hypothetical protein